MHQPAPTPNPVPVGTLTGLWRSARQDILSGFLVFLLALPLCLGIASACGYPPIAGIFTAVIGGLVAPFLSNSELTIKGPAAGLIVIAIGCIQDFGGDGIAGGWTEADQHAYRLALGVGVAAATLQILFAVFRTGILGEFFPVSVVHGMLAAIGIIIIAKQLPVTLGIEAKGEPLQLLLNIPHEILQMNPEVALIGAISLAILFGMPWLKHPISRRVPAPIVVVLISIPLGMAFDLSHTHTYTFGQQNYEINEKLHLVNVPDNLFDAITFPDFSGLKQPKAWKWVMMFALIGTLESMLSAKAIDLLDPWKRRTNLDRDNLAVGVGNLMASLIGGLPMISEIVRSKANIDNGARTRFANMFHGLFLLLFVATVPMLIHRIPMAALGAMLVYTGTRLASPREFARVYAIGREQFVVFVVTAISVLATDLLLGIVIGVIVKFLIHFLNGLPLRSIFKPALSVEDVDERTTIIRVREAAVFMNWIPLRRCIANVAPQNHVLLDLSETHLVDHTVMDKLHELEIELAQQGRRLEVMGLDAHVPLSDHPHAARRKFRVSGSSRSTSDSRESLVQKDAETIGNSW
jgi:MFS superfamily sulfate permease-like transporter